VVKQRRGGEVEERWWSGGDDKYACMELSKG
jgi:hypothetical protein